MERRYDVLAAIRKNERASLRDLCDATGIKAPSQVHKYLDLLEADGLIWRQEGARGIHLGKRPSKLPPRSRKPRGRRKKDDTPRQRSLKADPGLQARIDTVVEKALTTQASHQRDVMAVETYALHIYGSLGACRLG